MAVTLRAVLEQSVESMYLDCEKVLNVTMLCSNTVPHPFLVPFFDGKHLH